MQVAVVSNEEVFHGRERVVALKVIQSDKIEKEVMNWCMYDFKNSNKT